MTLQQLHYIVEIANYDSINKAAQHLYVTQPCLSNAIKSLEEEFHIKLLVREKRGIQFTPDGRIFLEYAKRLLKQAEEFEHKFVTDKGQQEICFSFSMQHYHPIVEAFIQFIRQRTEQKYELHLREVTNFEAIEDVYTKRSNAGIIFISESNQIFISKLLKNRGIQFEKILEAHPNIFVREGHPLCGKSSVPAFELRKYPQLYFEKDFDNFINYSDEMYRTEGQNFIIYSSDRGSVNAIIRNTDCFMIGTGIVVREVTDDGIISIPIEGNINPIQIGLIELIGNSADPVTEEFVALLKNAFMKSSRPPKLAHNQNQ